jgi:hypothetical protein
MKRILILLAGLFLVGISQVSSACYYDIGSKQGFDSAALYEYQLICNSSNHCSLSISDDGAWGASTNGTLAGVGFCGVAECQQYSSQPDTCRVVDVDQESDFIKNFENPPESVQQVNTVRLETPEESFCYKTYHEEYGEAKWLEMLRTIRIKGAGAGSGVFANPVYSEFDELTIRCAPYLSADSTTWIGKDAPHYLVIVDRTIEEYDECYSAFHDPAPHVFGSPIIRTWSDAISHSNQGTNTRPAVDSLKSLCNPFLSSDQLTWTAPLPEELETQSEIENQIASSPKAIKTIDPSEPKAPGVVDSQPTEADKNIELEFWQSIKDSTDADMYRAYLRKFPSGVYSELAKIKIKKLGGDTTVANASIPRLDYGDYYALVIGNNDYQDLTNLRSAVNDAKVVSTVLEVDYGFNVKLLENASRKEILRSLKHLRQSVSAKDNVLIYYAGHGYLDKDTDYGYWLPVDSERDDDSNWIPTDRVVSQVKGMKAKHVMVVADSCFSGTITRAIKIEQRTPEWLSEIVKKKARTALTSGGLEPVLDTGSGNHSAFAYAFISLLEENDGVLDASQLFSQLRPKVMVNSTQTPEYGKIHMAGDDGGDFLFVRR